jgi:Helix-turn-helix domain
VRSDDDVRKVFELWDKGVPKKAIARQTGVSRTQVRQWVAQGLDAVLDSPMRRPPGHHDCALSSAHCPLVQSVDERAYAYLLGMYLGDGHITAFPNGVDRLRITLDDKYPSIMRECANAIKVVMPGRRVGFVRRTRCHDVYCYSKHWQCLFPQHGPGRKHNRPILLRRWQERIVYDRYPELLVRGLIHTDGCRCINRVKRPTKTGLKRYEYPRYMFKNESGHIRGIFIEGCQRVGIDWRWDGPRQISIARRRSVALLDSFVGSKT